jgi:hypothetical protein
LLFQIVTNFDTFDLVWPLLPEVGGDAGFGNFLSEIHLWSEASHFRGKHGLINGKAEENFIRNTFFQLKGQSTRLMSAGSGVNR